jgi:hypothetical protein
MKERTEVNPAQNLALALCGTNFRNQVIHPTTLEDGRILALSVKKGTL